MRLEGAEKERVEEWTGMGLGVAGREKNLPTLKGHSNLCCISGRMGKARKGIDLIIPKCFSWPRYSICDILIYNKNYVFDFCLHF